MLRSFKCRIRGARTGMGTPHQGGLGWKWRKIKIFYLFIRRY